MIIQQLLFGTNRNLQEYNQKFFRAGEVSWKKGTLIKKRKERRKGLAGKLQRIFSKILLVLHFK